MARRCFFSFHYQDVIDFRANVVRKHNITKDNNGGFFDASIWESAKKQGDLALKRLIKPLPQLYSLGPAPTPGDGSTTKS